MTAQIDTFRPLIIVAGMGRCGTSLMMQMLSACGVRCLGDWPDFEVDQVMQESFDNEWLASLASCAVKILDPARLKVKRPFGSLLIWLDRDPAQQAKSQMKFLEAHGVPVDRTRRAWRAAAADLRNDRYRHRNAIGAYLERSMSVTFEDLVTKPDNVADRVSVFLAPHGYAVSPWRMVAQVKPRHSDCLPYMLELQLLNEKRSVVP